MSVAILNPVELGVELLAIALDGPIPEGCTTDECFDALLPEQQQVVTELGMYAIVWVLTHMGAAQSREALQ